MIHGSEERTPGAPLIDRFFEAIPIAPVWVSLALAVVVVGLILWTTQASGELAILMQHEELWWQDRDARLVILLALLASYTPAAQRYDSVGTRRNLEALRSSLGWQPGAFEDARREILEPDYRGRRIAGAIGVSLIPLTALMVDRDPGLYLQREYWRVTAFWTYGIAAFLMWNGGIHIQSVLRRAREFSRLAGSVSRVDLFDLAGFAPFARQGLQSALVGAILLSFLALNLVDEAWLLPIGVLGLPTVCLTGVSLFAPMRGANERICAAKRSEVGRVNDAIRGDLSVLHDSSIAVRAGSEPPGLADLLAYRAFVEALPEWPFNARIRTRVLLYAAIPLGSWLGGALVERLLDTALA